MLSLTVVSSQLTKLTKLSVVVVLQAITGLTADQAICRSAVMIWLLLVTRLQIPIFDTALNVPPWQDSKPSILRFGGVGFGGMTLVALPSLRDNVSGSAEAAG